VRRREFDTTELVSQRRSRGDALVVEEKRLQGIGLIVHAIDLTIARVECVRTRTEDDDRESRPQ
jgi:hypothetical protein